MVLWYFNIDDFPEDQITTVLDKLPLEISNEVDRFKFVKDKKTRLVARLLIQKYVMETTSNWSWENWKLTQNKKPYLENGPFFNISHSEKIVIVGFSEKFELGVDIEEISDVDVKTLSENFHEKEIGYLHENFHDVELFYSIWTKKEAILKALGIGLLDGLNNVNVMENFIKLEKNWYLKEVSIIEKYKCSVCSTDPQMIINKELINYKKLNQFINEKILL